MRQSLWWGQGQSPPPEAESSVAFEALAEEPNLTLVTVFTEIWRGYISRWCLGRGLNLPLGEGA